VGKRALEFFANGLGFGGYLEPHGLPIFAAARALSRKARDTEAMPEQRLGTIIP